MLKILSNSRESIAFISIVGVILYLSSFNSMFKFFLLDIYGSHRLKLRTTRFILNHHTLSE